MLNKKQFLVLMLSTAVTIPLCCLDASQVQAFKKAVSEQFSDKMKELKPIASSFTSMVQKGNFDGIASKLAINLQPTVQFLINEMDTIKLNLNDYLTMLANQAPANYQEEAQKTLALVKEKLALLNNLKTHLEQVEPYADLNRYKDRIAKALEIASNSAEFNVIKENIKKSGQTLQDLLNRARAIDINRITNSLNKIPQLYAAYQNGQDISLSDITRIVAPGIKELRVNLLPIAPAIAAELAATALEVASLLKKDLSALASAHQMPSQLTQALEQINEIGNNIYNAFKELNPKIEELKQSLLQ